MDRIVSPSHTLETVYDFYNSQEPHRKAVNFRLDFIQRVEEDFETLENDLPNILNTIEQEYIKGDWVIVAAFQNALQHFLNFSGRWEECILLNEWGCSAAEALGDQVNLARWTHDRADIFNQQGQYAKAEKLYESAEKAYISLGYAFNALESCHMRSMVMRAQGKIRQAINLNQEIIKKLDKLGQERWKPHPLYVQALLARDLGKFNHAEAIIQDCLHRFEEINEPIMIAHCHHFIGELMLLQGKNGQDVETHLLFSLQLSQQEKILRRVPATQRLIGDLYRSRGDYPTADENYNNALEIAMKIGDQSQMGRLMISRSQLFVCYGQLSEAENSLKSAMNIYQTIGDERWIIGVSFLFVIIYFKQKRLGLAIINALCGLKFIFKAGLLQYQIIFGAIRRLKRT